MPQVLWAPLAEHDIEHIWNYVAQDNLAAADNLIDTIVEKCEMLAVHPEMGEQRPELATELRSFTIGNYVVFYRTIRNGVEVARVVHAARDVNVLF